MHHFPVGYRDFHPDPAFNYALNRWLSALPEDELWELAPEIHDHADWKRLVLERASRAEDDGRLSQAAFYWRAAEFYMHPDDPEKLPAYERFRELFETTLRDVPHRRDSVPFRNGELPLLLLPTTSGTQPDDRQPERMPVLIHGGFDSFMEELVEWARVLTDSGFPVVLFEGPGQGSPLRHHGLTMDPAWEEPVSAVLDHLEIDRCAIFGISLGGYLAPRAAAFEPRIERLVLCDVLDDFFDCFAHRSPPAVARTLDRLSAWGARWLLDRLFDRAVARSPETAWALRHGLEVSGSRDAFEFVRWLKSLRTEPFSHRITQDVLLLAGEHDHIVPLHQFYRQAETLVNARSFTGRLFTADEEAAAHCQIGNVGLMLDEVVRWLEAREARSARERAA